MADRRTGTSPPRLPARPSRRADNQVLSAGSAGGEKSRTNQRIERGPRPMKKTSFVIAILASALLAGACSKKKDAAAPMQGDKEMGSNMGSAMGSGDAMGSGMGSAMGSGSGA